LCRNGQISLDDLRLQLRAAHERGAAVVAIQLHG
jgi:hypothetical protein